MTVENDVTMPKLDKPLNYPVSVDQELLALREAVRGCKRPFGELEEVSNDECTCNLDFYRRRIEWLFAPKHVPVGDEAELYRRITEIVDYATYDGSDQEPAETTWARILTLIKDVADDLTPEPATEGVRARKRKLGL